MQCNKCPLWSWKVGNQDGAVQLQCHSYTNKAEAELRNFHIIISDAFSST